MLPFVKTFMTVVFYGIVSFSLPLAAQDNPSGNDLSNVRAKIRERDGRLISFQLFGTLEQGSNGKGGKKGQNNSNGMPSTPSANTQKTSQDIYCAFFNEKELLSVHDSTGILRTGLSTEKARINLRNEFLKREPKIFDGTSNYFCSIGANNKTVLMKKGEKDALFGDTHVGLRSFFSSKSLDQVFTQRDYQIVGRENSSQFGQLLHLKGMTEQNEANEIWLAPERGYLIVREEKRQEGLSEVVVDQVELIQSFWLPKRYTYSYYRTSFGQKTLMNRSTVTRWYQSTNDVPESLFKVELVAGDHATDLITNQSWVVGFSGEKLYRNASTAKDASIMSFGWLYMVSVSTLLTVTVLSFVRWKRQQLLKSA